MKTATLTERISNLLAVGYIDRGPSQCELGMAERPDEFPVTAQLVHYYEALTTHSRYAASLTAESYRSDERPTMPPQPTCHHTDGMCEHMVCPRELAS